MTSFSIQLVQESVITQNWEQGSLMIKKQITRDIPSSSLRFGTQVEAKLLETKDRLTMRN